MPIRTNRGRAAVYRKLWGWPMRSPTHLVVLLVVLGVLVIAISVVVPQLTGSEDNDPGAAAETSGPATTDAAGGPDAPAATTGAPASTSLPTRIPSPPQRPSSAEPEPAALDVAEQWARAWVDHSEDTTSEAWLAGLEPFTDPEYMVELATVDPQNVPSTEVTGPAEATESFTNSLTVTLPTDGATLSITLISTPDGWRVTSYEEVT
ncbi:hypothetical protein BLA60_12685 [Actinophytocola xinjiangensis]|uniref:Uncharacterized protein n=1 Tax=Actinophytocola xinjiangensis TaxID=485602 RepID=A0A7Z0WP60_9PSEU|nr:hypothetical protein [Actinophytocola xinjiangensis]OLF10891.1 hypothetical protein BLA60_12685 [Actinophytocola xinjiangensis]